MHNILKAIYRFKAFPIKVKMTGLTEQQQKETYTARDSK